MQEVETIAFIQARLTSSRLPNKVLEKIGPWTALELMLKRLELSKRLDRIVVLIPDNHQNDRLSDYLNSVLHCAVVRGDETDVLSRFIKASEQFPAKYYVRLTADCPLICPDIVDQVINLSIREDADYSHNVSPATFPNGFDVECLKAGTLAWIDTKATNPSWREHVTLGLREHSSLPSDLKIFNLEHDGDSAANVRLTLDYIEDLEVMRIIYRKFGERLLTIGSEELIEFYRQEKLFQLNGHFD